jgi:hypothetical protein
MRVQDMTVNPVAGFACFSRSRSAVPIALLILASAAAWPWAASFAAPQSESRGSSGQPVPYRANNTFRVAQNADGFTIDVIVDAKKNQGYIRADDQFASFVYTGRVQNNVNVIQPASGEIMGTWKGNKTLKEIPYASKGYFEELAQFSPIFLLVDLNNGRSIPVQIKSAYLDISASASDLQPYLKIGSPDNCGGESYEPSFAIINFGWGSVRDAKLIYSFGKASAAEFTANVGTFDEAKEASVESGLQKSSLNMGRIKTEKFKCATNSAIPACLAKLKTSGIFGSLADSIYLKDNSVQTVANGRIEYSWTGSDGKSNKRSSPFAIAIPLLEFNQQGPECGAPAPVGRNEKPIALSLDKKNYRVPLQWRGQLMPRHNKRLGLSLSAPKSSRHLAKVVVELSDGSTVASMPLDMLYFTPRMPTLPDPPKE